MKAAEKKKSPEDASDGEAELGMGMEGYNGSSGVVAVVVGRGMESGRGGQKGTGREGYGKLACPALRFALARPPVGLEPGGQGYRR